MSLNTLMDWMMLICGEEREFAVRDLSVHVYGEKDASYLVFEKEVSSVSPRVSDQYVLHPLTKGNRLYQQIQFLAECDFDFNIVMNKLGGAEYAEVEMNEIAKFSTIEVARYQIREVTRS